MGETNIVHDNDRIAIDIDLSNKQLPPLSQIRFIRATSEQELEHESFAITDPGALRVTGRIKAVLYSVAPRVTAPTSGKSL
jgi:hypothetical protein